MPTPLLLARDRRAVRGMTLKNTIPRKRQTATDTTATNSKTKHSILPQLLSEHEAAKYAGVSVSFLRRARREGAPGGRTAGPKFVRLESFGKKGGKNGGRILYAIKDLDEWLASLERHRVI
jgi:hypothetical protein